MKLSSVQNLDDKSQISALTGRIKKVFERRTGQGKRGPWSLQTLVLQDNSGEAKVTFWNRPDLSKSEGQIISVEGKMEVEEYNGTNSVKVAQDATMTFVEESPESQTDVGSKPGDRELGIRVGNALNVAATLLAGQAVTEQQFFEHASMVLTVGDRLLNGERSGVQEESFDDIPY